MLSGLHSPPGPQGAPSQKEPLSHSPQLWSAQLHWGGKVGKVRAKVRCSSIWLVAWTAETHNTAWATESFTCNSKEKGLKETFERFSSTDSCFSFRICPLLKCIYFLFLDFRERGRGTGERERKTFTGCSTHFHWLLLGCALMGDGTRNVGM